MSFVTQNASFSFHCICSSSSDRFVCWGLPNDLKINKKNLELINILFLTNIPLAAIYPLPQNQGRFCEENSLRYLDLCYADLAYHKLKIFPLL